MQWIIKATLLSVTGVSVAVAFKKNKPEYGMFLAIVIGMTLFGFSISGIRDVAGQFAKLTAFLGEGTQYLGVLLRVLGITYLCEFGADVCKDAGYQAVALQVEMVGKLAVMVAGLPVFFSLVEQIQSIL